MITKINTNWIKNLIFSLIASLIALISGIVLLEVIFGNWFNDDWEQVRRYNIPINKKIIYNVSQLNYEYSESIYTRDGYGLRTFCPIKDIDFITIGGSTTDQRSITDGKTFQDQLENLFFTDKKKKICIANAGIDGHSTTGNLFALEHWLNLIPDLKPKYYLLYLGLNDAGLTGINEWMDDKRRFKFTFEDSLKSRSALYRLIKIINSEIRIKRGKSKNLGHNYRLHNKTVENYPATTLSSDIAMIANKNAEMVNERIKKMLSIIKSKDAKAICVTQPHAMAWKFNNKLRGVDNAHALKNGLDFDYALNEINKKFLDECSKDENITIRINSEQFKLDDFYDYVHLTQRGTDKLSKILYQNLKNKIN